MTDSPIEEIKSKLDIVELVREYVNLEKAGSNYRAHCPFHFEKTPSFFVNPSRQIWRCFGGCNEGGDIFQFVMNIEGVEFGDALRLLANKANVELKRQDPQVETKRKRLFEICELSTLFFERQLHSSKQGKKAKEYLLERGMTEETIKKWRLGYAPISKDGLSKFLIGEGYERNDIKEAGVSVGKGDALYDRFRARIIFPIFNLSGSPVGFGGRVVFKGDERAKYINTPGTVLYDKSAVLYGLHNAKVGIRKRGHAVLAEGYTDVILCHQAGYENVVSSSGTALTSKQLEILGRYTRSIRTAFDMDEAGGSATKKGIDMALQKEFDVRVIMMPEDEDPADIVSRSAKEWENYIEDARPAMEFYFRHILSKYDLSDPHEKGRAAKELLPEIKRIRNSIERSHFLSRLAEKLDVSEESIFEEMKRVDIKEEEEKEDSSPGPSEERREKSRKEVLEDRIGALCANHEELAREVEEETVSLFREEIKNLILYIKKEKDSLSEKEKELFDRLSLFAGEEDEERSKKELKECLCEIRKENIKEILGNLEKRIREAEKEGDEKKQEELLREYQKYSRELKNFK